MRKIICAKEVAELLKLSVPKAYEIMRRDDFPSFRPTERTIRTTEEALEEWIANQLAKKD